MYAKYKLKNGQKISAFLWNDIIKGEHFRDTTSCYSFTEEGSIDSSNEFDVNIKKDENEKLFFEFNGEKIKFEDFEFMTVDQLIEKLSLNEDKSAIREDDFLATFLKDTDNVGVIDKLDEYDKFARCFGIGLTSSNSNKKECLCVPTERRYEKYDWSYKVTLEAADEDIRVDYAYKSYYFSDLVSLIKDGHIKLVNRNTYELTPRVGFQKKKVRK